MIKNNKFLIFVFMINLNNTIFSASRISSGNLIEATKKNDIDEVERLIKTSDINQTDNTNSTALMYAVKNNNLPIVKLLLSKRPNLDIINSDGNSALSYAITDLSEPNVKLLIDNKATVNFQHLKLILSILNKKLNPRLKEEANKILKLLLTSAGNKIINQPVGQTTILLYAILNYSNPEIIDILLKNGADLNLAANGLTPLGLAIIMNNFPLIEFLINSGADINGKIDDKNFLSFATKVKNTKLVNLLLNKGISIENVNQALLDVNEIVDLQRKLDWPESKELSEIKLLLENEEKRREEAKKKELS